MTGDGLQDIVLVHDGLVEYWPSLGRGNWGARIEMPGPRFPWGYDPKRILLGDVDGDGAADLVYVDNTRITLWINQGGNGWSSPVIIEGTPPVFDVDSVRLADLLGNGVGGVLWSKNSNGVSRSNFFFLDFTGGSVREPLFPFGRVVGPLPLRDAPSWRLGFDREVRALA